MCMTRFNHNNRRDGISAETDRLSSELFGDALDLLATGTQMGVLLVIEDDQGNTASFELSDDGSEALINEAYTRIKEINHHKGDKEAGLGMPVRYAIAYEGAIAAADDSYQDALLLEFGEKGYKSYSAYSYVKGRGKGKKFQWTEPAAAGEVEPLL